MTYVIDMRRRPILSLISINSVPATTCTVGKFGRGGGGYRRPKNMNRATQRPRRVSYVLSSAKLGVGAPTDRGNPAGAEIGCRMHPYQFSIRRPTVAPGPPQTQTSGLKAGIAFRYCVSCIGDVPVTGFLTSRRQARVLAACRYGANSLKEVETAIQKTDTQQNGKLS